MPTLLSESNGNEPSSPNASECDGSFASEAESEGIENYSPNGSFSRLALIDGKSVTVRVAAPPSHASASSGPSAAADINNGANQDNEPDPYLLDYAPPESRRSGLRANKWRGQRPDGCWRIRARTIDFTDSEDIEESIPPYRDLTGRRYGQHPFPLSRLEDENGNPIEDEIQCYRLVTVWRKLSPADQKVEIAAIAARKKEAAKAAKQKKVSDNRNKNKREKRRARGLKKPGRKKKASDASDAAADEPAAESEVSTAICMLCVLISLYSPTLPDASPSLHA